MKRPLKEIPKESWRNSMMLEKEGSLVCFFGVFSCNFFFFINLYALESGLFTYGWFVRWVRPWSLSSENKDSQWRARESKHLGFGAWKKINIFQRGFVTFDADLGAFLMLHPRNLYGPDSREKERKESCSVPVEVEGDASCWSCI